MFKFNKSIVGTEIEGQIYKIDSRKTTNYAAALNDMNPLYVDDTRPAGIIAHPVFPVAVTWPLIQSLPEKLSSVVPFEVISRMVHYSEYLDIGRPVKSVDKLSTKGEIAAVLRHRAGTVVVTRIDAVDGKGEKVFTEYIGGMFRGVECESEGGRENLPFADQETTEDAVKWSKEIPVSESLPYVYDGCTDIVFPIHTSPAFAKMVGLPGVILQGTCTLALALTEIINTELHGDSSLITSISCNFGAMVLPGTNVKVELLSVVEEKKFKRIFFRVLNDKLKNSIKKGMLTVLV